MPNDKMNGRRFVFGNKYPTSFAYLNLNVPEGGGFSCNDRIVGVFFSKFLCGRKVLLIVFKGVKQLFFIKHSRKRQYHRMALKLRFCP